MADAYPFEWLAGAWQGAGEGSYPTIEPFRYTEELTVEPVRGRPVAHWRSRTRDAATGEPRHAESGFLRSTPDGVELVVAHSFGIVETATGTAGDGVLDLHSLGLQGTPSAKAVEHVDRRYELHGDELTYEIAMAAVDVPLTHHLAATLHHAT